MEIGDIISFGNYPQSRTDTLVKEPIEWVILDKRDEKILCISRYLLDCRPYHETPMLLTWADCSLRGWLNGEFLQTAFSREEQERIRTTRLVNHRDYPQYNTDDRVFLLDYDEAVTCFESDDHPMTRSARTTAYARSRGAWFLSPEEAEGEDDPLLWTGCWWLRCPGYIPEKNPDGLFDTLSCVNFDDYIEVYASGVEDELVCVRPALWLAAE